MPPWPAMPVLRHGADGELTDVVCGYLHSSDPLFDPGLRGFPAVFVVPPTRGPAADWVRRRRGLRALETKVGSRQPGLTHVAASRAASSSRSFGCTWRRPLSATGWLAAVHDPVLRPAMSLLHASPEHRWTVAAGDAVGGVGGRFSDARFREVLGQLADQVPDGLADAPGGGPAGHHRSGRRRRGATGRLRRGGGLQPSLQARERGESPSVWRGAHALR